MCARWLWILCAALALTLVAASLALRLRVDTDLSRLVPPHYESVRALERLRQLVGGESDVIVVTESPSFAANRAFAAALIPRALDLKNADGTRYLNRVAYRRDVDFLRDNALYLATDDELTTVENLLRDRLEEERLRASPLYVPLDGEEEASSDSLAQVLRTAIDLREYPISPDSTSLALRFSPAVSQADIGRSEALYADLEALVQELDPQTFHTGMQVTLAGRLLRQVQEVRAITDGAGRSLIWGVAAVLCAVVLYFAYKARQSGGAGYERRPGSLALQLAALAGLIGLPFLMSLSWTFALAYLVFGHLNAMSSTLGLVLFGLGIDYGIHFYARYVEERGDGLDCAQAIRHSFASTGQAIAVGALSTAAALFALAWSDFRGFSQFGFVAGCGVLFALLAMVVVLPALLLAVDRMGLLRFAGLRSERSERQRPVTGARRIVWGSALVAVVALALLPRLAFEYDFSRLEPVYADYEARQAKVLPVFPPSEYRNAAFIVVDDAREMEPLLRVLRARRDDDVQSPTLGRIAALQDRIPLNPEIQRDKLQRIAELRALIEEALRYGQTPELSELHRAASTTRPLSGSDLPDFMVQRFRTRSGELGRLVAVYPSVGLSDGRNSLAFAQDVGRVELPDGKVYWAGSTPLVAAAMLDLMLGEIPWLITCVACVVALLMWASFGSLRWALLALVPLGVGVLWMLLAQLLMGLKFNLYNIVVLPAILGIGNDAGAHLIHRYREEGPGSLRRVLRSTGEHISIGSLTTAMGFAGLLFSQHPGLCSMGQLALVGIVATWLAAVAFLPALLQCLEDWGLLTAEPDASRPERRSQP